MSVYAPPMDIYIDFLCPFTYRFVCWVDNLQEQTGVSLPITWRSFSLEQNRQGLEGDWRIWDQPDDYATVIPEFPDRRALLAFWGAEAARQQGAPAFDRFRRALFHARHQAGLDFSQRPNVEAVAAEAGLAMEQFRRDFANRALLDRLRRDHEHAVATYQAFGVPTICFDAENAVFIKLAQVPPPEETLALWQELVPTFGKPGRRWLAEAKRPNPSDLA